MRYYRIRIQGRLGPEWSEWFGGLGVASQPGGDTVLSGPVVDQAALHGILNNIRDLGLVLLAVTSSGLDLSGERSPCP